MKTLLHLKKTILPALLLLALLMPATPAAAQIKTISGDDCGELGIACKGDDTSQDLRNTIRAIINVFLVLVGILALIFIIIGGVRYITAQGNDDDAKKAKNTILYALIGLIVIGLAAAVVNFTIGAIPNRGGNQGNQGNQGNNP